MTPTFEAHESNPDGLVATKGLYSASDFTLGSVVLCRNTAPLVAMCYALLQRDVPCRILGKDIGKQLATLVKKMRAFSLEDFLLKLNEWQIHEVARAVAEDRSPERIEDQAACLRFFVDSLDEDSRSVDSLLAKIDLMFTDEANGGSRSRVTLSTIHKAKGLEFPTVFLLDWFLLPSRYAKQEWQRRQERNLQYVAVTRSMDKLFTSPVNIGRTKMTVKELIETLQGLGTDKENEPVRFFTNEGYWEHVNFVSIEATKPLGLSGVLLSAEQL